MPARSWHFTTSPNSERARHDRLWVSPHPKSVFVRMESFVLEIKFEPVEMQLRLQLLGTNMQPFPRVLLLHLQHVYCFLAGALGRTPAPGLKGVSVGLFCVISVAFALIGRTPTIAAEAQANRMIIEYVPPTNPAHQALYQRLMERRVLEKLQEVFSPFQLPVELKLRTVGCDGVSNAWYQKPAPGSSSPPTVSVCYEYIAEIQQSMPPETTPAGITPMNAMLGQFFYVFAHEMGHAVFDVLGVPVMGREEDAADNFATYLMLRFGDEEARALITGAAYSYNKYVQGSQVTVPLAAFSDAHSAPAQRFYNLLCTAYGSDQARYGDFVEKEYLPKSRAGSCMREFNTTAFAFRELISPHVDKELAKQVLGKNWIPESKGLDAGTGGRALQ